MDLEKELIKLQADYEDMCSVIDTEMNDFWDRIEALITRVEEEKE